MPGKDGDGDASKERVGEGGTIDECKYGVGKVGSVAREGIHGVHRKYCPEISGACMGQVSGRNRLQEVYKRSRPLHPS